MTHTTSRHDTRLDTLTITDRDGDTLRIGYQRETEERDGIGIHTTGLGDGRVVRIDGQDLTALRDLILSIPDEAFPPLPDPLIGALVLTHTGSPVGKRFRGLYARVLGVVDDRPGCKTYRLDFGPAADAIGSDGGQWGQHSFTVIRQASE